MTGVFLIGEGFPLDFFRCSAIMVMRSKITEIGNPVDPGSCG